MAGVYFRSLFNQLQHWFSQAQTSDAEEVLTELPFTWKRKIRQQTEDLGVPEVYRTTVRETLEEAIAIWQATPDAANSLVILGSPVQSTEHIFDACFADWQPDVERQADPIPWSMRPEDALAIADYLQQALEDFQEVRGEAEPATEPDQLDNRQTLIILPRLEQCFLRCIQGWQGIEYLRDQIGKSPDTFWLIGCNAWAWTYLNRVCQIGAYFNQVTPLPALSDSDLEQWLTPLVKTLDYELEEGKQTISISDSYWRDLASLSIGGEQVAVELWLRSLKFREKDLPSDINSKELNSYSSEWQDWQLPLQLINPVLPGLASLEMSDYYLLHSLLLHGGMTRHHLALSLGEAESVVQAQVQRLLSNGIIQQTQDWLCLQPTHYPRLKTELSNNNFLVGER
jgi:hypothetical protein